MTKRLSLLIYLFLAYNLYSQKTAVAIPDTIQNKDYDYLFERIEDSQNNSKIQSLYLKSFLYKAKSEENTEEIINGYKNYLHYSKDNLKLVYADSMIYTAKQTGDNALIGSAYLTKGIAYYGMKQHKSALDNYLIANKFISQTRNEYLVHKVKYNIAHIKYYLGFYNEAISLFKECMGYFKDNNPRPYLNSIHSLGLCYNRIGNYGLCTEMNKKGLAEGKRLSNNEMDIYFTHLEGINQYFKGNYQTSIEKIKSVISALREAKDFANESVGYFYIGKSYWKLDKFEMALPYFKKVDKIFVDKKYIRPDLIENYQLLIDYYKSKKDLNKQLYYIKRMLTADSILDNRYQYLTGRIYNDYDSQKILKEMKNVQYSLELRKYNDLIFASIVAGLLIALSFIVYCYRRNKIKYRQNFMELMKKNEETKVVDNKTPTNSIEDISQDTISSLLLKLEKFEKEKKFLEKNVTLAKLAVSFNTNINYLYKIVYHFRGKKFTDYVNDLKIDYIINLMKQDKMFRNYTNKALAEEIGFSTTQRFANAFYARTGISTAYFIKEIKKADEVNKK
ncbi:YesN/AraC family two-component response regulator [Flavobacterium sp. 90]|uniref:AraC family transcriptional regulator n=1 Tax=unclassified Flavobacterium TaxID=196869 RepID=UPI000EB3A813|nr:MULTISPECIES: AraC family transcriptional regulator [unclassified Flavobacterium]RKR05168.1 YesN/AraC family two-component response regulator [Flavobacterium sp. 81]TCK56484.1 YesN/AraC family two-component response regulator [Flavobacterium sp. 90]